MADKAELLAHAYEQGWLPKEKAALYEHAVASGYVHAPSHVRAMIDANSRERGTGGDVRALSGGASLGLAKHLDAASAAIETGLHNLASRATGGLIKGSGYNAGEAFNAVENAQGQQDAQFRQAHPNRALTEELGGSLATPGLGLASRFIKGAAIAKDAALGTKVVAHAARAGRAGLVGAGVGATQGAATAGSLREAPGAAVKGAMVGGAFGAAGEPAIEAVGAGVNRLASGARGALTKAKPSLKALMSKGDLPPEVVAHGEKTAREALASRLQSGQKVGKGDTLAEALGPNGAVELGALARKPGTTGDKVKALVEQRRAEREQALQHHMHEAIGINPEAAHEGPEAVIRQGREAADPLYAEARAHPGGIWDSTMERLFQRPEARSALEAAKQDVRNSGRSPTAKIEISTEEMVPGGGKRTVKKLVDAPTVETLDLAKKNIAASVDRHPLTNKPLPDSVSPKNHNIGLAADAISSAIKSRVPAYKNALQVAGDYKAVEGSYNRFKGTLFSDMRIRAEDFRRAFSALKTEPEKSAARHALAADLFDHSQGASSVVTKLLRANGEPKPAIKAKLEAAFGKDATAKLFKSMQAHREQINFENKVLPGNGSPTMPLSEASKRHGEESGAAGLRNALAGAARGNLGAAITGGVAGYELGGHKPDNVLKGALGGVALRHGLRAAEMVETGHRNALGDLLLRHPSEVGPLEISIPAKGYRYKEGNWIHAGAPLAAENGTRNH
jgi:hypothetical protein